MFTLWSCSSVDVIEESDHIEDEQELDYNIRHGCYDDIVEFGDTNCYNLIKKYDGKKSHPSDLLFWSIIMANKYSYEKAYLDVFNLILDTYVDGDIEYYFDIDSTTQEFMIDFLDRAVSSNIVEAHKIKSNIDSLSKDSLKRKHFFETHEFEPTIENRVLYLGDIGAYNSMLWEYVDEPPQNFLFWALIMANRYDYLQAYSDVYSSLYYVGVDNDTRQIALKYLKIGVERNCPESKSLYKDLAPQAPSRKK